MCILGPSDVGPQSKIEIGVPGWGCTIKPANERVLSQTDHDALVLTVKRWQQPHDLAGFGEFKGPGSALGFGWRAFPAHFNFFCFFDDVIHQCRPSGGPLVVVPWNSLVGHALAASTQKTSSGWIGGWLVGQC